MGMMQRRKGRAFEQRIARLLRSRWPDAVVRRASQADRAHQSDVYITGGPEILSRLWLECHDAAKPVPIAKLKQAEGDITEFGHGGSRYPVVIWHKLGAREINVTSRLWVTDAVRSTAVYGESSNHSAVTISLDAFLDVVDESLRLRGR